MSSSFIVGIIAGMQRLSTLFRSRWQWGCRQLFPPACVFCQQQLAPAYGHDFACCEPCFAAIYVWPAAHCLRCGIILPDTLSRCCGRCLQQAPAQMSTHSLFQYRGSVRQGILHWKLSGQDAALRLLLNRATLSLANIIHADDLLVPIPAPLSRIRQRGMHHTADLCRMLAVHCGCQWEWRWLRRQGNQARQATLKAHARRKNLRRAFTLNDDYQPNISEIGKIWLIDDIITTGSTMHYAARCLRSAGMEAHAWSLAHTPSLPLL